MLTTLRCLLSGALAFLKSRGDVAAEVIAVRHQLAVLQRERKTPRLNRWDRILWVFLSKTWPSWHRLLVIVQPDTVIRWHSSAFKFYW